MYQYIFFRAADNISKEVIISKEKKSLRRNKECGEALNTERLLLYLFHSLVHIIYLHRKLQKRLL